MVVIKPKKPASVCPGQDEQVKALPDSKVITFRPPHVAFDGHLFGIPLLRYDSRGSEGTSNEALDTVKVCKYCGCLFYDTGSST